eukprot:4592212-Ditylum_brightwellii.AAC.1
MIWENDSVQPGVLLHTNQTSGEALGDSSMSTQHKGALPPGGANKGVITVWRRDRFTIVVNRLWFDVTR